MQNWEYLRLDGHYKDPKDQGVQSVFSNVTFQELHRHINKPGSEGCE